MEETVIQHTLAVGVFYRDLIFLCHSVDPTRLLLTFNVSVNLGDKYHKNTALHWAVLAGNTTVISLLLDANANVDAQNIKVATSSPSAWALWLLRRQERWQSSSESFAGWFSGRDAAGSCKTKEERLDDQSLTGSTAGQRLRQPIVPEKTKDGQGTGEQVNAVTSPLRFVPLHTNLFGQD